VLRSLISTRTAIWRGWIFGAFLLVSQSAYAQTDAVVARNHPKLAEMMTSSGRLEASRTLSMAVTLALRNRDELQQLIADQQNPASPEYQHFLTPEEFAARFGPSDFDAVREWLTSEGFTVTAVNIGTRVIQFTGTVAQAEHTFGVAMQSFGGASFGIATDPRIPARFDGVIGHIHGLDNMSASMPGIMPNKLKPVASEANEASSDSDGGSSVPGVRVPGFSGAFFGPSDFYTFYDETPLANSGLKGSGCIGIIGDSQFLPAAISSFNSKFKLGASHITTVLADSGNPGFNGDEVESDLDLEWSHAVAPGAATRFYLGNGNSAENPISDAIAAAVTDEDRCQVISISFGFCGLPDSFYTEVLDPLFSQAAAQGQSVITITHDAGAVYLTFDPSMEQCVPGSSLAVSEMAADPNVTALSGTSFDPVFDSKGNDVGHVAERVWNDPDDGIPESEGGGATGGGMSSIFTKPAFQSGPGVPADGMRDVPDVSLIASPNFPGSVVFVSKSCANENTGCTGKGGVIEGIVGGTSLSAPAFAGIADLIGQASGKTLGNMDPTIYKLATNNLAGSGFRDVTSGDNSFNGVTGFTAAQDYDLCTGWGTVDAAMFVAAYASTLPGPSTVTLSPSTLNFKTVRVGTKKSLSVSIAEPKGETGWTLVDSVATSGAFTAAQTCVGQWIGPGKSCKFGVTFKPTAVGPVDQATLTVTDDGLNSPQQMITLNGTGK
jgi:subtilase family serine protease